MVLLIAPSANHRILFRAREKQRMLRTANAMAIAGLAFLAAAVICVIMLITDYLYGVETTVAVTAVTGVAFAGLWYGLPLVRRARGGVAPEDEL
jgi:peptidoglycan/LPS O-acetylase OafA/YrhL